MCYAGKSFNDVGIKCQTWCYLSVTFDQASTSQSIIESAKFRFLQRLSVIFGFRRDCPWSLASCQHYRPRKLASCRDCPCDSASCRESQQEAESHGQSLQESIYQVQQSRQEARDQGQSQQKPNMMDSFRRKCKLADWFIPCDLGIAAARI